MASQAEWDKRFLRLAREISTYSKDPSTKVGAVITFGKEIVSTGYNGFPAGVEDTPERLNDRALKYDLIIHGEINAILFAKRDLFGATLYTYPFPPCVKCACIVTQVGIARIVTLPPTDEQRARWGDSFERSYEVLGESGVLVSIYEGIDD